ncbi:hypothetical protein [Spiroplasma gladiatoris]|uniref:hypothetical protein n=1 Tax=Spiroplasma gladiatoris TaxID=2143 RepID=UPI001ABAE032|nr:hypothetical protein [Spiroplasma gladiatoris]
MTLYELQRSSDITYRLYDFDREDKNGNKRELHIEDSLNNVNIPDDSDFIVKNAKGNIFNSQYFSLFLYDDNNINFSTGNAKWLIMTVINGNGQIDDLDVKVGETFMYLLDSTPVIKGNLEILIAWINK